MTLKNRVSTLIFFVVLMEVCKSASAELGEALAVIVGSAVVIVTDAIVAGQREGHVHVSDATAKRFGLLASNNLTQTLADYFPARIRNHDVTWETQNPHNNEWLRWKWVAGSESAAVGAADTAIMPFVYSTRLLGTPIHYSITYSS